jgi:hypothetical protein
MALTVPDLHTLVAERRVLGKSASEISDCPEIPQQTPGFHTRHDKIGTGELRT